MYICIYMCICIYIYICLSIYLSIVLSPDRTGCWTWSWSTCQTRCSASSSTTAPRPVPLSLSIPLYLSFSLSELAKCCGCVFQCWNSIKRTLVVVVVVVVVVVAVAVAVVGVKSLQTLLVVSFTVEMIKIAVLQQIGVYRLCYVNVRII